ncbi:MAG: hypothetical protein ABI748_05185 [Dokdonella sp.]
MLVLAMCMASTPAWAEMFEDFGMSILIYFAVTVGVAVLIVTFFLCLFHVFTNTVVYVVYVFLACAAVAYFLLVVCADMPHEWFLRATVQMLMLLGVGVVASSIQYWSHHSKLRIKRRDESATLKEILARTEAASASQKTGV